MPVAPPVVASPYPTIEDVVTLARVYVNDTILSGAGVIFTDNAPFILPLLNSAIAQFQRDLWNRGVSTMVREIFWMNIPPINSALGVGVPNAGVFPALGYTGYNDGLNYYAQPALPSDLLLPLRLWQRSSQTNLTFSEFFPAQAGLPSTYQEYNLGEWEWQGDMIVWNGALIAKDVRMRYLATVRYYNSTTVPAAFPTTQIPFRDSVEALAYYMAYEFASSRLPAGGANDLLANYQKTVDGITTRYTRSNQRTVYERGAYGNTGDLFGWFG